MSERREGKDKESDEDGGAEKREGEERRTKNGKMSGNQ